MTRTERGEVSRYLNRDLSWVEFNKRVLEEAQDPATPLLERAKFLAIVSTNLDEFMSVRVAGLQDQQKAGYTRKDFTGYTPSGLLKRIMKRTSRMVNDQYKAYREAVRFLGREGIYISRYDDLTASQKKAMDQYYTDNVFPVLTPMGVDQSRPFPLVNSLSLYLAVVLLKEGDDPEEEPYFAIVRVPSNLSRLVRVPARGNSKKQEFVLLDDLIKQHIRSLFAGYVPLAVDPFRLTRNADLTLNEEGAEDLLEEIEKELRRRRWGVPVRLEVHKGIHAYALEMLKEEFEIEDNVFVIDGPIDLSFLMKLPSLVEGFPQLRYPELIPVYPEELEESESLFEVLGQRDVLLYHPYESFDAVNDFLMEAAEDPYVLAVKITLYRVSGHSVLIQALSKAAESGKQVTVVVELKARFDEERNIAWARQLEKAGCHVVYGLVGLKTHAKITLVVRQEQDTLRRYVHVGTGNYNENSARLYTDLGLFTSDPLIGEDASSLFNEITGFSAPSDLHTFAVAPTDLLPVLQQLIRREAEHAAAGRPARIIAKMNSLSNQEMVDALYEASQAGVPIDLIVRGVCCLRPGVEGLSETITVRSIVDRFLEHSRVVYFENGGEPDVRISSADWMTRNLTRRIELMCPVRDEGLKQDLIRILHMSLEDNVKARHLQQNGLYSRPEGEDKPFRSQFEAAKIRSWKKRPPGSGESVPTPS
ncbi:polyphosphate kinase 1 [Paenibacillus aurantius]|uniref:Polyphosphate kinase n=1 Tax=Paenibacillus aurantius TaxID=2918900 RepID=A0AA96LD15_9BACL|nr:polyphosphate kinase 1 [Paenibacillus aurantius]WNQ09935.1 polyphosphate kinase 1 [Paenibacillus aurantius]